MPIDLRDIEQARNAAVQEHSIWKRQLVINDNINAGRWTVQWPDDTLETGDPHVENVYEGSLVDKVGVASQRLPSLYTQPTRGTRNDRAERSAEKRRRAMRSIWDRSAIQRRAQSYFYDWFHTGVIVWAPWLNWIHPTGRLTSADERFPFMQRIDPRFYYPLGHNYQGEVTQVLIARQRRLSDLYHEYGRGHPALAQMMGRGVDPAKVKPERKFVEELWWFDGTTWGVAVGNSHLPATQQPNMLMSSAEARSRSVVFEWLVDPAEHGMSGCPVVERKRITPDGAYRGALEQIIPQLRVANDTMAKILDDLDMSVYAPTVLDNVANPNEWGPGAVMVGTGEGTVQVVRDRPPVNFEAGQVVNSAIQTAHRQGRWPVQRSGDPDASIVSAKGVIALAGSFNSELATAQRDFADGLERATTLCAEMDEVHADGAKLIEGAEGKRAWAETYTPSQLYNGDHRCIVTYGETVGLDEQNLRVKLATELNLGTISKRTFMVKSGTVDDPLQEERDVAIERLTDLYITQVLPQRVEAGDVVAIKDFVDRIDRDDNTVRSAVLEAIRELQPMATEGPPGTPGPEPGPGNPANDPLLALRSLQSGGIPGQAPGLPQPAVGDALRRALPANISRLEGSVAPGGTGI